MELAAKPEPVTVTTVPIGPLVGLMAIDGVTVKVAEAEFEDESVATTVCAPTVEVGAVKVVDAGIAPPDVVVTVTWVTPSYFMVVEELAAKPEPVTVTDWPIGPVVGLSVSVGAVTVKVADFVLENESVATT